MESPLSLFRMHWGHEPCSVDLFISNELRVRFMESPHDFDAVQWDLEPVRIPLNRPIHGELEALNAAQASR